MSERFRISDASYHTIHSSLVGRAIPPARGTIRAADVECLSCGHQWRATERAGLSAGLSGTHIQCPNCKNYEVVK